MMTIGTIDTIERRGIPASPEASTAPRLTLVVRSFAMRFLELMERQHSRAALRDLTDAQLRDIGLTRREAIRESRRPLWDWNDRF